MKINSQNYKVCEVGIDTDILERGRLLGIMFQHENKIYVRKDLTPTRRKQVIAHEVMHTLFAESGVGICLEALATRFGTEEEHLDIEEIIVTGLENVFYNFLKDNTNFYVKL